MLVKISSVDILEKNQISSMDNIEHPYINPLVNSENCFYDIGSSPIYKHHAPISFES